MDAPGVPERSYSPAMLERLMAWFDVRRRGLGMVAFSLNRLTASGLVLYLGLHLVALSLLAQGENAWDNFIGLMRSPLILVLDVVLVAGLLIHGLNGVRMALVGVGLGVNKHKAAFVVVLSASILILIYTGTLIFQVTK